MAAPSLIPPDVETALNSLSPEQRQQVFDFVAFLYQQQNNNVKAAPLPKQPRHFGQYRGRISMSEDFDAPLPDSFWLGES
jgi:mRNA-degrading endonuclease RelE of RelBE toxin-antitoxin system